jgi:hypothetical protein
VLDWSSCLTQSEVHRKKAESELAVFNAGLSAEQRAIVREKAEKQLCLMLSDVIDALVWLRSQR